MNSIYPADHIVPALFKFIGGLSIIPKLVKNIKNYIKYSYSMDFHQFFHCFPYVLLHRNKEIILGKYIADKIIYQ